MLLDTNKAVGLEINVEESRHSLCCLVTRTQDEIIIKIDLRFTVDLLYSYRLK
jgi:hypothetical protein